MSSIVLELQEEITRKDCDIVNILRRAHLIANKLKLTEFDKWIMHELNGYPDVSICPEYRKIRGTLKAFNPYKGWIPTLIPRVDLEKAICEKKLNNSISEIIFLCNSSEGGLVYEFTGEQLSLFNSMFNSSVPMKYYLHISTTSVFDIVEKVKNTILEWTLKLEFEGVIGENMTFTEKEKSDAQSVPQTVNYYYGNTSIVNSPKEGVQIVSGDSNIATFSYSNLTDAIGEIENTINSEKISEEDKELAIELLSDIKNKVCEEKNTSIIKSLLVGLMDFLSSVGAGIAVNIVQAKIQGLF